MTDYTTYLGFDHLEKLNTATSLSFDCETTGLKPEVGGLRLLQFGSAATKNRGCCRPIYSVGKGTGAA